LTIKNLLEEAILESCCMSDIYNISESIKKHLNDLDWIKQILKIEDSKLKQSYNDRIEQFGSYSDIVMDYMILGDTIARNLDDCGWVLSCYEQAEKYARSVMDYYVIASCMFEKWPKHERVIDLINKAYKLIEVTEPCSTEVTLLASLSIVAAGDEERATELYKRALAIDQHDGICWDDRQFISHSIKENLKDHEWSEMILRQSTSVKEDPQNFSTCAVGFT
jgi:hypothetical protein